MRLKNSIAVIVGLGLTMMTTMASAETWRFGIEEIKGSVQYEYAAQFKKLIEKKSGGDVTVQVLPYGSWGSVYSALYDATQNGAIQIAFASGALGATVPESQLLNLNFVMPADQKKTTEILNSDDFLHSDAWEMSFKEHGLFPISELPEGYQVWTANKAIRTPADIKGLNIRTMDNSLLLSTYRAYGAAPSNIAYGELYSAMQQGQVEGNIQPVFAHQEMSFYEVQDYMIFAKQAQFVATAMTNLDWYEGLSDKQRKMIRETTDELVDYGYKVQKNLNDKRLDIIKSKSDINIIELTDDQRDKFRELAKPVRQTYVDQVGERGQKALDILLNKGGME